MPRLPINPVRSSSQSSDLNRRDPSDPSLRVCSRLDSRSLLRQGLWLRPSRSSFLELKTVLFEALRGLTSPSTAKCCRTQEDKNQKPYPVLMSHGQRSSGLNSFTAGRPLISNSLLDRGRFRWKRIHGYRQMTDTYLLALAASNLEIDEMSILVRNRRGSEVQIQSAPAARLRV
jgi:hypothetical protein